MIEVAAKLIGGPVYLPGDNVGCCVSFVNRGKISEDSTKNSFETLALCSAQIHCICITNEKVVLPPDSSSIAPEEVSVGSKGTSFLPYKGDNGHIVFSSKPKILFCDLKINNGEIKSFLYMELLPADIPPSYKGQLVKYSYKITLGMQRINCPIKLMKIPVRILVIDGFPEASTCCEDSVDLSPSNPFLDKFRTKESEPALQVLQNITARRNTSYYNITNSKGKVARFCLFKQAYKLGEDISGTFDFENSEIPCVQFTVSLQCEETIMEKYRVAGKRDKAVMSYNHCHEFCLNMSQCFVNLPIPIHITPAFSTKIMSLKWKLHFEFVTGTKPKSQPEEDYDDVWQAPKMLDIETMVWDLPVQIYPTTNISDLTMQTKSYLTI